jgi:hypothetical protein
MAPKVKSLLRHVDQATVSARALRDPQPRGAPASGQRLPLVGAPD